MANRIYTPNFSDSPHFINPFKGFKIGDKVWIKRYDLDYTYIGYVHAFPKTYANDPDLRMTIRPESGERKDGNFLGSIVISCLTNDNGRWHIHEVEYFEACMVSEP